MADRRDEVLDALMIGDSIGVVADRFGLAKADVREILKDETDRAADGAEMRAEWMLTQRRLRRMELAFDRYAIENLDCNAALIAIKASERRASLSIAGSAQPSHLVAITHAKALEEAPTSTQQLRNVLDNVLGITHRERQLLDRHELDGDNSPEVLAEINQLRADRGKPPLDEDKQDQPSGWPREPAAIRRKTGPPGSPWLGLGAATSGPAAPGGVDADSPPSPADGASVRS